MQACSRSYALATPTPPTTTTDRAILIACTMAWACSLATAQIRVPADQPTIQAAIDASPVGFGTVLVAPGTYRENLNFRGKWVQVISERGPAMTTIDGGGLGSVAVFINSEPRTTLLEGFTITNGRAIDGGGIYIQTASPTIRGNRIVNNVACSNGAGIAARFGSARIEFNEVAFNTMYQCGSSGAGGGIFVGGAQHVEILSNWIHDNVAHAEGGGIAMAAGGPGSVVGNVIERNSAQFGGGLHSRGSSTALVANNFLSGNWTVWVASAIYSKSDLAERPMVASPCGDFVADCGAVR